MTDDDFIKLSKEMFANGSSSYLIFAALQKFFQTFDQATGSYDFQKLEMELGGDGLAWSLIYILRIHGILKHGTSPNCGWLTEAGEEFKEFVLSCDVHYLVSLANYED